MSAPETGLPTQWEVRHSNSKNLPYYFNPATKESRWEPPPETDPEKIKTYMAMQHNNNVVTGNNNVVTGNREGKIRAAHLLVKHRDSRRPVGRGNEEIVRSKETALGHLAEYERMIRSGEISLGDLAKEKSDCMSGKKHGDLGFFGLGQMQKPFEQAAFALKRGEISGVVETASGVHLIQRLE